MGIIFPLELKLQKKLRIKYADCLISFHMIPTADMPQQFLRLRILFNEQPFQKNSKSLRMSETSMKWVVTHWILRFNSVLQFADEELKWDVFILAWKLHFDTNS